MDTKEIIKEASKIGSLVDSEYDVLQNMSKQDIENYLLDLGFSLPAIARFFEYTVFDF